MKQRTLYSRIGLSILLGISCLPSHAKELPPHDDHEVEQTLSSYQLSAQAPPLYVIIPSYNNAKIYRGEKEPLYKKNLDSLMNQTESFHAFYIDDASPDGTGAKVAAYLKTHPRKSAVTLVQNKTNKGALANIYDAIMRCEDRSIIITLDGDDWLADQYVLSRIRKLYDRYDVWITYGQYRFYPNNRAGNTRRLPDTIIQTKTYRTYPWVTSHLRSFYAKLFKKIAKNDLMYNGQFFKVAWDLAFMFPMLEMAGKHSHYISRHLYWYNFINPLNDERIRQKEQLAADAYIRSKPTYPTLDRLFENE